MLGDKSNSLTFRASCLHLWTIFRICFTNVVFRFLGQLTRDHGTPFNACFSTLGLREFTPSLEPRERQVSSNGRHHSCTPGGDRTNVGDTLSISCLYKSFIMTSEVPPYRGTSLLRNCPPLGPYSRSMPRALAHKKLPPLQGYLALKKLPTLRTLQ